MTKKLFDMKIIVPHLLSLDNYGNENTELVITDIDETDRLYDILKDSKEITNKELNDAIKVVLTKMTQEKMKHIVVDLDRFADQYDKEKTSNVDDFLQEHRIMKKFIIENGLWEKFINNKDFINYLREDWNGD